MNERHSKKAMSLLLWGMVLGYTILYISLIFNDNIWTDEAFTWQLIHKGGFQAIVEGTAEDVHPPLYYFYARVFTKVFGDNLRVLKAASIVPMTALCGYLAVTVRKYFGDMASFLSLLFITNIPCTMEFAVQPRMYSASLLAVTVCGVSAYLAFTENRKRDWIMYALSAVTAAYLHYFAFAAVGFTGLILLVFILSRIAGERKRKGQREETGALREDPVTGNKAEAVPETKTKKVPEKGTGAFLEERTREGKKQLTFWFVSLIFCALLYAPWLPVLKRQVSSVEEGYWIPDITMDTIRGCFNWAFGLGGAFGEVTTWIVMAILVSGGAILLYEKKTWKEREKGAAAACLVPALVFAFGITVSVLPGKSTVYRDQYILPALGLLSVFFGVALLRWNRKVLAGITCFMLVLGAFQYRECYRQEYHNSYVEQTKAFLSTQAQPDDPIIYNWKDYGFIYAYYWNPDRLFYYENFDWGGDYDTVWLLATYDMWVPAQEFLDTFGLTMEDMGPYGIEQDNFEIYKITKTMAGTADAQGQQGS